MIRQRRLTSVVAGAGFGKSTLLAAVTADGDAWYRVDDSDRSTTALAAGLLDAMSGAAPEIAAAASGLAGPGTTEAAVPDARGRGRAIAALLADAMAASPEDLVLVVDDLHELGEEPGPWALLDELVRLAPPGLHFVFASREPLLVAQARLRADGRLAEITAQDLAFDEHEIRVVLDERASRLDDEARRVATGLVAGISGGWPAAVRLAVEAVADVGDAHGALDRLRRSTSDVFDYLAEEVLAAAPEGVGRLVRLTPDLSLVHPGLAAAIGVPDAARSLEYLAQSALFVVEAPGAPGWYRLHDLIRSFARERQPMATEERKAVLRAAATWYEGADHVEDALRMWLAASAFPEVHRLVVGSGIDLARRGAASLVHAAAAALPAPLRGASIDLVDGEACMVLGQFRDAEAALQRALEGARADTQGAGDREGAAAARQMVVAAGSRLAVAYGLRSAWRAELEVLRSLDPADGTPEDRAAIDAWLASGMRRVGQIGPALEHGRAAVAQAEQVGDDRVLTAALTSLGAALQADGQLAVADDVLERSVAAAIRAGDPVQEARAHAVRGSVLLDLGRLSDGDAELVRAADIAAAVGMGVFEARAIADRARGRGYLGRLEEAFADIERSRALLREMDVSAAGLPDIVLGEIQLARGEVHRAREALERGVAAARGGSDQLYEALGLGMLAQLALARDHADAARIADEAEALGRALESNNTLCYVALVRWELGDRASAGALAAEAERFGRRRNEPLGVARALELRALAEAGHPGATPEVRDQAIARIEEAASMWRAAGAKLGLGRNRLDLAVIADGPVGIAAADEALAILRHLGAQQLVDEATARKAELERGGSEVVTLRTLGGFAVVRGGTPIPLSTWRSKKARDLLKLLAPRGNRPMAREALAEQLWPDENPTAIGNRLAVALATARAVIDPGKAHPSDWYVAGDRGSVWLDTEHIGVDVVDFRAAVADGRRLLAAGDRSGGLARLAEAEAMYGGAFCEDDPYEDWAIEIRDELQAEYIAAVRTLALAASASDPDGAARYHLRVLEWDAYDETAHLGLIEALMAVGRHGEARRRHGLFAARMAELGVEVAPLLA
jgi:ATP/maltotriose-dependent transcriptional regulator MalT/DNA-binding SARP family transcriptional activator